MIYTPCFISQYLTYFIAKQWFTVLLCFLEGLDQLWSTWKRI